MPILSTHELARNNHKLEYDEDKGLIRNKTTGETTSFVQRAGVYFIQLFVPKQTTIAQIDKSPFGRQG